MCINKIFIKKDYLHTITEQIIKTITTTTTIITTTTILYCNYYLPKKTNKNKKYIGNLKLILLIQKYNQC